MSAAPVEVKAAPVAKVAKKPAAAPKAKPNHPTFAVMITEAIKKLNERSGSSKQAISKYIASNYQVDMTSNLMAKHFRVALVSGSTSGFFKQVKGTGANGSFKVGEATKTAEKVAAKKEKDAAKPKKEVVKKAVAKKPAAKAAVKTVVKVKVVKKKPAAAVAKPDAKPKKNVRKPVVVKATAKKAVAAKVAKPTVKVAAVKKVVAKKAPAAKKTPVKKTVA